jgi:ZIP family zinc transporter
MNGYLQAALWGWFAGSSLLAGTLLGWYLNLPTRTISSVMAFGSGVLISAISFELMDEAYHHGGFIAAAPGFLAGIFIYTLGARFVNKRGAKFRKRSGEHQKRDGNARAIALGALLDGIPESIVIGLSLLSGKGASVVTVAAIFISNVPEALSSSSGMKKAGRSQRYIFILWGGIVLVSGLASFLGYALFGNLSIEWISSITALAAGAILAMIVDTMIPEAFEEEGDWAGVITGLGFLVAFIMSKLSNQI